MFTADCPPVVVAAEAAITGKVAIADEDGIVRAVGTVRAGLSLETATVTPPAGAGTESLTVQVLVDPALRLVGLHVSVESSAGLTFKVAVPLVEFKLAVMVALWLELTLPAVAVNVTELASASTVTEDGTLSTVLLALNCTLPA
jgi:hypothetical protein